MNKKVIYKLLPYMIMSSIALSGCGKKSECELPTRHVHLYTKEFNNGITINKYKDDETLYDFDGYNWTESYIEINKKDEAFFKEISRKGLFNAKENWDYLYNKMSNDHDYLEFYYKYVEKKIVKKKDSQENEYEEEIEIEHTGWHTDKYSSNNTGRVKLCHHQYSTYRIEYENGKYHAVESPYADDCREYMEDYPYANEYVSHTVEREYYFSKWEVPFISVEDFYDEFGHPDLSNNEPTLNKTKTK